MKLRQTTASGSDVLLLWRTVAWVSAHTKPPPEAVMSGAHLAFGHHYSREGRTEEERQGQNDGHRADCSISMISTEIMLLLCVLAHSQSA
ncbi:hypothetical protein CesoFtcFv8_006800 [Champsocephalus esox]|uniref:Uncharacterized protein n=2 Tax=Champsocephalus TaxID=52236 RepID=A0AAN8DWF0_CHAGU|nr:hypothetical protein CesoFtcFv8_006800 [Champsocephalus esox]KAK5929957.1 hypothetical protein CgunFtcFv8_011145 [Champsocephalus gunnari]